MGKIKTFIEDVTIVIVGGFLALMMCIAYKFGGLEDWV